MITPTADHGTGARGSAGPDARAGDDLGSLATAIAACTACPVLAADRHTVVPGEFPPGAALLLVGEAPGAAEDATGRPFVGRAGALLERLLAEVGVRRGDVALANTLKCRPPGNRPPTRAEAARCRPWLDRQVALAAPRVVVTLGGSAAAWAFGRPVRLGDVRGRAHERPAYRLVATYHPSAALRFGPAGAPLAALRADLALAVGLVW